MQIYERSSDKTDVIWMWMSESISEIIISIQNRVSCKEDWTCYVGRQKDLNAGDRSRNIIHRRPSKTRRKFFESLSTRSDESESKDDRETVVKRRRYVRE